MNVIFRHIVVLRKFNTLAFRVPGNLQTEVLARPVSLGRCLAQETAEGEETAVVKNIDPSKDRTQIISVETSISYLKSKAYQETYGVDPVWRLYRRNHKGGIAPSKTRKTCIRQGIIATGNPCPICRDEYLVIDHTNVDLLKQFISPHTGEILSFTKTGLCQKRHEQLLIAIEKAKDYGFITFDVPFREYDYRQYYKEHLAQ
ncbi:small ribosomal subunit protein mS40 [Bacillus rossius redtenbacheri]|uniref:small ribosomal subunit protein mS40 n=1 Tax=Bacillus rossius redtenbacheri TaxID=93214 RepID=UPI002FDE7803